MNGIQSSAIIEGLHRYRLVRLWDKNLPVLVFLMLNPSTADGTEDDNTIRKIVKYAKRDGYGAVIVVNLFAYRSTDPSAMFAAVNLGIDIVGPRNDYHIEIACRDRDVIVAWGASTKAIDRAAKAIESVRATAKSIRCLGVTKDGHPKHPLYVRDDQPFVAYPKL